MATLHVSDSNNVRVVSGGTVGKMTQKELWVSVISSKLLITIQPSTSFSIGNNLIGTGHASILILLIR